MQNRFSRRNFMKTSALGAAAAATLGQTGRVHAAGSDKIRVGLVGCGGRGCGAARQTLEADPSTELVAVGDAFREKAEQALEGLNAAYEDEGRVNVAEDAIFDGLKCHEGVINAVGPGGVILLCQTPYFRPMSLRAAIEGGCHVFCEKPVASDAPGIKSVMESTELAKKKNLNLVSGLCWRYDLNVCDMMNRVKDGAIGDIVSARLLFLTGKLWKRPRQADDTEMRFQVRNWYNHAWLSGDFNVEQHVHTLDKALWAMNDVPPDAAFGLGARMQRVEQPDYGDIYDSMATVFEYKSGVTLYSFCRQQDECWSKNEAILAGTKGTAEILSGIIRDYNGNVVYQRESVPSDMYLLEHQALYKALHSGNTINNGDYMAKATMMGIMAREVCYSGKRMTWEEAFNGESLAPSACDWEGNPPNLPDDQGRYKIPVPGLGKVYHSVKRD